MVQVLLEAGADSHVKDVAGRTPLDLACAAEGGATTDAARTLAAEENRTGGASAACFARLSFVNVLLEVYLKPRPDFLVCRPPAAAAAAASRALPWEVPAADPA